MIRLDASGRPQVDYICGACAADLGGGWPKGYQATFHVDKCGACERQRTVCATHNYIWRGCRGGNCE